MTWSIGGCRRCRCLAPLNSVFKLKMPDEESNTSGSNNIRASPVLSNWPVRSQKPASPTAPKISMKTDNRFPLDGSSNNHKFGNPSHLRNLYDPHEENHQGGIEGAMTTIEEAWTKLFNDKPGSWLAKIRDGQVTDQVYPFNHSEIPRKNCFNFWKIRLLQLHRLWRISFWRWLFWHLRLQQRWKPSIHYMNQTCMLGKLYCMYFWD